MPVGAAEAERSSRPMFDFVALRLQYLHESSASCGVTEPEQVVSSCVYTAEDILAGTRALGRRCEHDSDIATILPVMHWESPEAATVHSHTCGVQ